MFKRIALIAAMALLLAACGTPATPEPLRTPTLVLPTRVAVVPTLAPNETPVPPTETPIPPTPAPTQPPAQAAAPTEVQPTTVPPTATMLATATSSQFPLAEAGRQLFVNGIEGRPEVPTCLSCHHIEPNQAEMKTGPSLVGVASRAGQRVPGQPAGAYLRNSIIHPNDYIVPNEGNQVYGVGGQSLMYQNYEQDLTPEQLNSLVQYLQTLR